MLGSGNRSENFGKNFYKKGLGSNDYTMDRSLTWSGDIQDLLLPLEHDDFWTTDPGLRFLGIDHKHVMGTKINI
jgi:hypothetical protein